jgi:hypothetical protein
MPLRLLLSTAIEELAHMVLAAQSMSGRHHAFLNVTKIDKAGFLIV